MLVLCNFPLIFTNIYRQCKAHQIPPNEEKHRYDTNLTFYFIFHWYCLQQTHSLVFKKRLASFICIHTEAQTADPQ